MFERVAKLAKTGRIGVRLAISEGEIPSKSWPDDRGGTRNPRTPPVKLRPGTIRLRRLSV